MDPLYSRWHEPGHIEQLISEVKELSKFRRALLRTHYLLIDIWYLVAHTFFWHIMYIYLSIVFMVMAPNKQNALIVLITSTLLGAVIGIFRKVWNH
jgi:hypothetical protein